MNTTRRQYVQEWATKTGRSRSDVYVPFALQPPSLCLTCGWSRQKVTADDGPGNHRGCQEGRW